MKIHPTAVISEFAKIGSDVEIGAYTVVHSGVEIGEGATVEEHGVLGGGPLKEKEPLFIPPRSIIRSHAVVYAGSRFNSKLETGHHVMIRERTSAGDNLRVGNFSDIEGDCFIGDYCRFHGYVHVGKGSTIGNFVWLFSLTTATNDPLPPSDVSCPVTIADGAVVCVGATLMPGSVVGKGAMITSGSHARGTIPNGAVVSGKDGHVVNHVGHLIHFESGLRHPWMRHFRKSYPEICHPRLDSLMQEIMQNKLTLKTEND